MRTETSGFRGQGLHDREEAPFSRLTVSGLMSRAIPSSGWSPGWASMGGDVATENDMMAGSERGEVCSVPELPSLDARVEGM